MSRTVKVGVAAIAVASVMAVVPGHLARHHRRLGHRHRHPAQTSTRYALDLGREPADVRRGSSAGTAL